MIKINGAHGEGGGQILRYATLFAALTKEKIKVENIRVKRPNPGLRPQHIGVIKVMHELFGGELEGLHVGSLNTTLKFGELRSNYVKYNIGTAGSIPLILQSLIPALSTAEREVTLELMGGTDVKWSPTIDYMNTVYKSIANLFNVNFNIEVIRRGYYPKGMGIVRLEVYPSNRVTGIECMTRGEINYILIRSVVSLLPQHISNRQVRIVKSSVEKMINKFVDIRIEEEFLDRNRAYGPGVSLLVVANHSRNIYSGGDSIGEKGKPAEVVGKEATEKFFEWFFSRAFFDKYAGDMIIPFASIASGRSIFTVPEFTRHMESALYVMKTVTNRDYQVTKENKYFRIEVI